MSRPDDLYTVCFLAVGTVLIASAPFLTSWPWRWLDNRKIRRFLDQYGAKDIAVSGRFLARWQRVNILRWIPVREYQVVYTDAAGRRHKGLAEFYLPWWLNKLYDPGVLEGFDWTEGDVTR